MSGAHECDAPVLVRSGLRLDECTVETCVAVKVCKRNASDALKMVQRLLFCGRCPAALSPLMRIARRRSCTVVKPAITPATASGCAS